MVILWYYYGNIMVLSSEEERRKSVFTYKEKEFFAKAQQAKASHKTN